MVIWNVRGCNKPFKHKEIKKKLQRNKVDVAVLLETRVKQEKTKKNVEKMCRGWNCITNYQSAVNGRIWVVWNPKRVQVSCIKEHEQSLHSRMVDIQSGRWYEVIAVYALNTQEQRRELWKFIGERVQLT